jgi:hypothetical protein
MTTTATQEESGRAARDVQFARMLREAIDHMQALIEELCKTGLRVELTVEESRMFAERYPVPLLMCTVVRPLP